MFIIIARVFATLLAVLVLSRLFSDFKARKESIIMVVFWTVVWVGILIIAYFSTLINILIDTFGGDRTGLGTVFGMAIIFILFINYRIYVKAQRIENYLKKINSKIGLKDIDKK